MKKKTRFLTYEGRTLSVARWAKERGIKEESILFRLSLGWPPERCLLKLPRMQWVPRPLSLLIASHKKEYRAFHAMRQRCYNTKVPGYKRYGGRGIKVCELWRVGGFEQFLKDVGRCPPGCALDRIQIMTARIHRRILDGRRPSSKGTTRGAIAGPPTTGEP